MLELLRNNWVILSSQSFLCVYTGSRTCMEAPQLCMYSFWFRTTAFPAQKQNSFSELLFKISEYYTEYSKNLSKICQTMKIITCRWFKNAVRRLRLLIPFVLQKWLHTFGNPIWCLSVSVKHKCSCKSVNVYLLWEAWRKPLFLLFN